MCLSVSYPPPGRRNTKYMYMYVVVQGCVAAHPLSPLPPASLPSPPSRCGLTPSTADPHSQGRSTVRSHTPPSTGLWRPGATGPVRPAPGAGWPGPEGSQTWMTSGYHYDEYCTKFVPFHVRCGVDATFTGLWFKLDSY